MTKVSLLLIGNELLDGRLNDTNGHYFSLKLKENDFNVVFKQTVADNEGEIIEALNFLAKKSDVILISGGLGPTSDDLTRDVVAKFLETELVQEELALNDLKDFYKRKKRELNPSNIKQTLIPKGSTLIRNKIGTASMFRCYSAKHDVHIVCFPGVPYELKTAFIEEVLPWLNNEFSTSELFISNFRFFGIPESVLHDKVEDLNLDSKIDVAYRASFPEIELLLKSYNKDKLKEGISIIDKNFSSKNLFATNSTLSLPEVVHKLLAKNRETLSLAESCTGGLTSALLLENPGASAYYPGGIVSYSNEVKEKELNVSSNTLNTEGAVSSKCVEEMAIGVKNKFGSTFGLSISGIAGPDGGSDEKPVGTFFVGLATKDKVISEKYFYFDKRKRFQTLASYTALNLLRNNL